jgi:hypothetical protein
MRHAALQQKRSAPSFAGSKETLSMNLARTLRNAFRPTRVDPVERYLSEATSLADLEQREREISRGRFGHPHRGR